MKRREQIALEGTFSDWRGWGRLLIKAFSDGANFIFEKFQKAGWELSGRIDGGK
jgi:hypothetical protein